MNVKGNALCRLTSQKHEENFNGKAVSDSVYGLTQKSRDHGHECIPHFK